MKAKLIGVAVLAAVGLAAVLWHWHRDRCESDCAAAAHESAGLLARGEAQAALKLLDAVDARCTCERFTSGDAPPEYSLAQACIRKLQSAGRTQELDEILARATGPILKSIAASLRAPPRR